MANIIYRFFAETGKAIAGFVKLEQAQKKVEGQSKKTGKTTNDGLKKTGDLATSAAGNIASMVGGLVSVGSAATLVVGHLKDMDRYAHATSLRIDSMTKNLWAYTLMNSNDPAVVANSNKIVNIGYEYGMEPGESLGLQVPMQAQFGKEKSINALRKYGELRIRGAEPEATKDFITAAGRMGFTPSQSTGAMAAAGNLSTRTSEEMAVLNRALLYVEEGNEEQLATMMGMGVAMMAVLTPDKTGTAIRSSMEALKNEYGPTKDIYKKLGVSGKSPLIKLKALHDSGAKDANDLGALGFTDTREIQGIAATLATLNSDEPTENFLNVRKGILAGISDPNYVSRENEKAMAVMPTLRANLMKRQAKARAAGADIMDPQIAQRQEYRTAADHDIIRAMREEGRGSWVNDEVSSVQGPWNRFKMKAVAATDAELTLKLQEIELQRLKHLYESGTSTDREERKLRALHIAPELYRAGASYNLYSTKREVTSTDRLIELLEEIRDATKEQNANGAANTE